MTHAPSRGTNGTWSNQWRERSACLPRVPFRTLHSPRRANRPDCARAAGDKGFSRGSGDWCAYFHCRMRKKNAQKRSTNMASTRIERDTMGEMAVPADALYGAQTARAAQNFPISQIRLGRPFIRALGLIKACAARVNGAHGWLEPERAEAIERAA